MTIKATKPAYEHDMILGQPIHPVADRTPTHERSLLTGEPLGPTPVSNEGYVIEGRMGADSYDEARAKIRARLRS